MSPNIRQELILAPIACLLIFAFIVTITYVAEQRVNKLHTTARLLEQQRMGLQMLFRGINESLLTDGTPDSVKIANESIAAFEDRLERLSSTVTDPMLRNALESEIGPTWRSLRAATKPFRRINDVNGEDDALLIEYGRLLVDGDAFIRKLDAWSSYSQSQAQRGSRQHSMAVVGAVLLSLLTLLWLFRHLYRVIAVPLNKLSESMLDVSNGNGELIARIRRHRRDRNLVDERALNQEVNALNHSFQFMLGSVGEHLARRQEAESQLKKLNEELERRVWERTRELRGTNERMSAEIEHREKAQQALERAQRENARILEAAGEGIYGTDTHGRITFANPAAAEMLGWGAEEMVGQDSHLLFHHSFSDARPYPVAECDILKVLDSGQRRRNDSEVFWRRNGSSFPVDYTATPVQEDGRRTGVVVVFRDISEKKLSDRHIYQLAHYDGLTNLPNRILFEEHLGQSLSGTRRRGRGLAVLFIDLDRFKYINDTLGHSTGDKLLQEVARRLLECVRPDDAVSRIGGDEFTVLLRDVRDSDDVARWTEELLRVIARPMRLDGHQLSVSASVGISLCPEDGTDMADLQSNADIAMYHAKAQGKGAYRFFTASMNQGTRERLELESGLRVALERDEFELAFQPQVGLADGVVTGVEALLRWVREDGVTVGPDRFIPIAEDCGLIIAIDDWVLRTACRTYRQWRQDGIAPARISVNLSARQLQDGQLLDKVRDTLRANELDPCCLELELTEHSVMENPEDSIVVLRDLKAMGVKLAVDDFGVAYSSLSYLKRLPLDRLKIDRSFIRDIPGDADDTTITATIIAMAHTLGLEVTAEGVETEAQLALLRARDCDEVQGFLFSRPIPDEALSKLLTQWRPPDSFVQIRRSAEAGELLAG